MTGHHLPLVLESFIFVSDLRQVLLGRTESSEVLVFIFFSTLKSVFPVIRKCGAVLIPQQVQDVRQGLPPPLGSPVLPPDAPVPELDSS